MGVIAKYDLESLVLSVRDILVNKFNKQLDAVIADKAKDASAPVFDFKYLGGGVAPAGYGGDGALSAIDIFSMNRNNFSYDPYCWVQVLQDSAISGKGDHVTKLGVFLSVIDPKDGSGEIRLARYIRVLKELFYPMLGARIGIVSLSAVDIMPCLARPDFVDETKRRLTWGYTLSLTW